MEQPNNEFDEAWRDGEEPAPAEDAARLAAKKLKEEQAAEFAEVFFAEDPADEDAVADEAGVA